MKALTQQEIARLLTATTDTRLRTMILVAFRHGMRASEICGLKWSDIDLSNRTILCRRLKGSVTSTQALSQIEVNSLTDWHGRHPESSKYVFPSVTGLAGSRATFYRQFHAACLAAGLPEDKAHPHALRHALGFVLAEANVSLPIIQAALGHKNPSNTFIYAKPSQAAVDKAMKSAFDSEKSV